jgi:hypothetical protein
MTPSVAPWRVRPAHRPTLMGLLPTSSNSPMQRSYLYVNGREPSVLVEVAAAPLPGNHSAAGGAFPRVVSGAWCASDLPARG